MSKLAFLPALLWKESGININECLYKCNRESRCLETTQVNIETGLRQWKAFTLVKVVLSFFNL